MGDATEEILVTPEGRAIHRLEHAIAGVSTKMDTQAGRLGALEGRVSKTWTAILKLEGTLREALHEIDLRLQHMEDDPREPAAKSLAGRVGKIEGHFAPGGMVDNQRIEDAKDAGTAKKMSLGGIILAGIVGAIQAIKEIFGP